MVLFLNKNWLGFLSILTFVISIIFLLIVRGPDANIVFGITVFTVLSILGIIFAIASRQLWFMILGVILNLGVLVYACFLLLAVGISG